MKRILLSIMTIALVAVVGVGATRAYFSDVEISEDNTFEAGVLDLEVDFDGYYNKEVDGQPNAGHWVMTSINDGQKFFDPEFLSDLKPGDYGEGTISLHVDNDAWLRAVISEVHNDENACTEPEAEVDASCDNPGPGQGDLAQYLEFMTWVDDGDNIYESEGETPERLLFDWSPASDVLGGIWWDLGMISSSEVHYLGVAWRVPEEVGNIIQSDSLDADITFEVEQYRHNEDGPSWND